MEKLVAKQKPIAQIEADEIKAATNVDLLTAVQTAAKGVDSRTLSADARDSFKEAKANIQQALTAQRSALKQVRADLKAARKA